MGQGAQDALVPLARGARVLRERSTQPMRRDLRSSASGVGRCHAFVWFVSPDSGGVAARRGLGAGHRRKVSIDPTTR